MVKLAFLLLAFPAPLILLWVGIDEAGKGDYFGPLVTVAAVVRRADLPLLAELGVTDSKKLTDARVKLLAQKLRPVCPAARVAIDPPKYNELHARTPNVNDLLGWSHALALEKVLEQVPEATWALSDQFAKDPQKVRRYLKERGKAIRYSQWPRAETDPAVAVASVFARADFLSRLERLGQSVGVTLPKGAGAPVLQKGRELARRGGRELLARVAKLHFRTTQQLLGSEESSSEGRGR